MTAEVTDLLELILAQVGMPAGAIALAIGVVRGAGVLEKDASEPALKYVSSLLAGKGLTSYAGIGLTIVPLAYDKIFGKLTDNTIKRFCLRSTIVTLLTWIALFSVKRLNFVDVFRNSGSDLTLVPWLFLASIMSILKARHIMEKVREKSFIYSVLGLISDVILTFFMPPLILILMFAVKAPFVLRMPPLHDLYSALIEYLTFSPISEYVYGNSGSVSFLDIGLTATLFTSVWMFLFLISGFIVGLLTLADWLRRFTVWWFRDIDAHPLTAIAKVTAALIIIIAAAVKTLRFLGL